MHSLLECLHNYNDMFVSFELAHLFRIFIYLSQSYKEKGVKERFSICRLTPQMATTASAVQVKAEPEALSWSPT